MAASISYLPSALTALPSKCTKWVKDHPVATIATVGCVASVSVAVAKIWPVWKEEYERMRQLRALRAQPVVLPCSHREIDQQFYDAMIDGRYPEAWQLVKSGADPNARVPSGQMAMQRAIQDRDLYRCKRLIDMGAGILPNDLKDLNRLLTQAGVVLDRNIERFFVRRPPFFEPQLFYEGSLQPLERCAQQYLQGPDSRGKEIFLFVVGDEKIDSVYGGVTSKLQPSYYPFYARIAKNFSVVVTMVDEVSKLVFIMQQVRGLLVERPICYMDVHGHGNPRLIKLGMRPEDVLTRQSVDVMKAVRAVLPNVAMLSFSGCMNAYDKGSVVQSLSQHLDGCVFAGSAYLNQGIVPKVFFSKVLQKKMLLFGFPCDGKTYVKLYAEGRLLKSLELPNGPLPPDLIQTLEDYFASLRRVCQKQSPVFENYFD